MNPLIFISILIGLLSAYVLKYILFSEINNNKNKNAPKMIRTGLPVLGPVLKMTKDPLKFFKDAKEEYGDVCTMNMLNFKTNYIFNAKDVKTMLFSSEEVFNFLAATEQLFKGIFVSSGIELPPDFYSRSMSNIRSGMAVNHIQNYMNMVKIELDKTLDEWENLSNEDIQNGGFSFFQNTFALVSRITGRCILGLSDDDPIEKQYLQDLPKYLYSFEQGASDPTVVLFPNLTWLPASKKLTKAKMEIFKIAKAAIQSKIDDPKKIGKDYLSQVWIPHIEKYGIDAVADNLFSILYAAQLNTAGSLSWMLIYLSALEKERNLMLSDCKKSKELVGEDNTYGIDFLKNLERISYQMKETARLRQGGIMIRKILQPVNIAGKDLPVNSMISFYLRYFHMNEEIFENPSTFDSERWNPDVNDQSKYQYNYFLFGWGRHFCLGEPMATGIIKLVTSYLFTKYDLKFNLSKDELLSNSNVNWQKFTGICIETHKPVLCTLTKKN